MFFCAKFDIFQTLWYNYNVNLCGVFLIQRKGSCVMKVKNMVRNRQSSYLKLIQLSNRKFQKNILVSVVALAIAFWASSIDNEFFKCLLSIISLVLAGSETVFKLIKGTKDAKIDTILVVAAILIPFCIGEFSLAATAMAIYKLSTLVISLLLGSLGKGYKAIIDAFPKTANIIDSNSNIRAVSVEEIRKGTKIMIRPDEIVPVDCVITEGFSDFDTSLVCELGKEESLSSGDKALAGYVNTGSTITGVAVCDFEDSISKDLNRLADMSESTSTLGEKRLVRISKIYPTVTLVLAIVVLLVLGMSSGEWAKGMSIASVLLIAATTGSFLIATPLFTSCAIWRLKKKGMAVATAEILDEIADINCVAFEKNGILTDGVFKISKTYTADGFEEADLLMIAGICVGGRTHPISKIFTKYMNEHLPAENVMEFPGKGVECTIMGKTFLCGSEDFIKESGVDIEEVKGYRLYITIDKVLMGAISYEDELSESSIYDIELLRKTGVEKIVMLTPDKDDAAKIQFAASGADEYVSGLTPFGRAETINKIKQEEGATCAYVGEALGAEQAMEEADVGVSLISKEANGLEYSKVALLGKLKTLADAIEFARNANGKIEIHFYCAAAVKIITVLLGLFAVLNVGIALLLDALLTIFALISARELLNK